MRPGSARATSRRSSRPSSASRRGAVISEAAEDGSDFSLANLPYGVVRPPGGAPRVGVAIGEHVLDLAAAHRAGFLAGVELPAGVFAASSLNGFMALGPSVWHHTRAAVLELLGRSDPPLLDRGAVESLLPFTVADYVDFYASEQHATTMGRLLRPGTEPLPPAWKRLPIGYHGRAGTIVVSGTPITRPAGQTAAGLVPSACLDVEVEVGFVVGVGHQRGTRISAAAAAEHVFGAVLLNDWSARDVQAFEAQPLGPFLGKSFATSISPWVIPLEALARHCVTGPAQDPAPLSYLQCPEPRGLNVQLELALNGAVVSRPNAAGLYWSMAQQLAHLTVNGAATRTGDLFATGTISGPDPAAAGSLMELTWRGERPLTLPGGPTRAWLLDGDVATIRGWSGEGTERVGWGEVTGTIQPCSLG